MLPRIRRACQDIRRLFRLLDRRIARFKKVYSLECPADCGHCCAYPDVEATVQEFIPLALALWRQNGAEEVLEQLKKREEEGKSASCCVFYKPFGKDPEKGRCSVYLYRGIICRLFGFSFREAKDGSFQLLTCSFLKSQYERSLLQYEKVLKAGRQRKKEEAGRRKLVELLQIRYYVNRLNTFLPELGDARYPVNEAIWRALEWTGFYLDMYRGLSFMTRLRNRFR